MIQVRPNRADRIYQDSIGEGALSAKGSSAIGWCHIERVTADFHRPLQERRERFKFRKRRGLHRYLHPEIGIVFIKEGAAHRLDGARVTADPNDDMFAGGCLTAEVLTFLAKRKPPSRVAANQ